MAALWSVERVLSGSETESSASVETAEKGSLPQTMADSIFACNIFTIPMCWYTVLFPYAIQLPTGSDFFCCC